MTGLGYILAARGFDGDLLDIVIIVVVLVLAALGALIKKVQEKAATEKAERARGTRREQGGQPPPPPRRPQQDRRLAQEVRRTLGLQPAQDAAEPPLPAVTQTAQPEPIALLQQETRPRRPRRDLPAGRRLARKARNRVGTLESAAPAEPTTAEARRLSKVHLADPMNARQAIIYHEIFSAPKALRQEPEMWDQ